MTLIKRQIFYSFHYANDVFRVQQIRNIGQLEENKPVSANEWEEVKRKGKDNIKSWIDTNIKYRSCVVVLVGKDTHEREWVRYEIEKAWTEKKGLMGIYIHNLRDPRFSSVPPLYGKSLKGTNPFDTFEFTGTTTKLSSVVQCYDPNPSDPYNDIARNIERWVTKAIDDRK